jgi:hypothetical protein
METRKAYGENGDKVDSLVLIRGEQVPKGLYHQITVENGVNN